MMRPLSVVENTGMNTPIGDEYPIDAVVFWYVLMLIQLLQPLVEYLGGGGR